MNLQSTDERTRGRGRDRQPRAARTINDFGLAAKMRAMCEEEREVDVAARLRIGRSTLRRIIRGQPFDKGLRLHLLGSIEVISEHFLSTQKQETADMFKTGATNEREIHSIDPAKALQMLRQVGRMSESEATEALTKITKMRPDLRGVVIDERAVCRLIGARLLARGIR